MNIQRFGWPVIIAASLHGSLFLISSEPAVRPEDPVIIPATITLTTLSEDLFPEEPDVTEVDQGGPVSSCALEPLRLPELWKETAARDKFTVPITTSTPPLDKVTTLEGFTGQPAGPGSEHAIGRPRLIRVEQLDEVPRAVVRRAPLYPEQARREGTDGSVTVEFVVETDGRVSRAEAVRWTRREFVEPAVRAVQGWRFEPGTVGGRKVSFRMAVPIEFNAAP